MSVDLVADVGNTRIKWGRCSGGAVSDYVSLPPDDAAAWQTHAESWQLFSPLAWAVAGVSPVRRDRLAAWLRQRGDRVQVLESSVDLPLRVCVEHPERVGIDRLLNAVAANCRRQPEVPVVIVSAGSAVTVDRVDRRGAFRGGAIFPGFRLMAQALHDYTALLPLVEVPSRPPNVPATSTAAAIEAGVYSAVAGGICRLVQTMTAHRGRRSVPQVFLTGGDGSHELRWDLSYHLPDLSVEVWPQMTLEGIRLAAEGLP